MFKLVLKVFVHLRVTCIPRTLFVNIKRSLECIRNLRFVCVVLLVCKKLRYWREGLVWSINCTSIPFQFISPSNKIQC